MKTTDEPPAAAGAPSPNRYAGWNVLDKWHEPDWDEQTGSAVRRRLQEVPPIRFLSAAEVATLEAIVEHLVPQPARDREARVQVVPWIDEKLHLDARDGYRYAELPPLREAWRRGIAGIDESARLLHGAPFASLDASQQHDVLRTVEQACAPGETWAHLPAGRFFRDVLCLTVVKTYYAHPAAWNEIGYSGPAAVRGHVRNWMGGVDPWDAPDPTGA